MITEQEVFSNVAKAIRNKYEQRVYVANERLYIPPMFPCVSIVEIDTYSPSTAQTFDETDEMRRSVFEIQTYSNLVTGASIQAKELINECYKALRQMGYRMTTCHPVENYADASIKRYIARFDRKIGAGDTL